MADLSSKNRIKKIALETRFKQIEPDKADLARIFHQCLSSFSKKSGINLNLKLVKIPSYLAENSLSFSINRSPFRRSISTYKPFQGPDVEVNEVTVYIDSEFKADSFNAVKDIFDFCIELRADLLDTQRQKNLQGGSL